MYTRFYVHIHKKKRTTEQKLYKGQKQCMLHSTINIKILASLRLINNRDVAVKKKKTRIACKYSKICKVKKSKQRTIKLFFDFFVKKNYRRSSIRCSNVTCPSQPLFLSLSLSLSHFHSQCHRHCHCHSHSHFHFHSHCQPRLGSLRSRLSFDFFLNSKIGLMKSMCIFFIFKELC